MLTNRSAALAVVLFGLTGTPLLAATCNLTVEGAHVVDDATCTVTAGRGITRAMVEGGSTIEVRRSIMSARLVEDPLPIRHRRRATSYGQVVTSDDADDRTCYFNQKAVLCVER